MWRGLVHIRESEIHLGTGELLYNVIAVYIITVQIKTSAKFVSNYNLLAYLGMWRGGEGLYYFD